MSRKIDQFGESITVERIESTVEVAILRIMRDNGFGFMIRVANNRLEFYSDENSAGTLGGAPIVKNAEEIWDWIREETPDQGRKKFEKRIGFRVIGQRGRERAANGSKSVTQSPANR